MSTLAVNRSKNTISTFSAPDISCEGCANAIRRALGTVEGIAEISVDAANKTVTVMQNENSDPITILSVLDRAGFPATQIETGSAAERVSETSGSCCRG